MKRIKSELSNARGRKFRLPYFLLAIAALYLIFIAFKFPYILKIAALLIGKAGLDPRTVGDTKDVALSKHLLNSMNKDTFHRKLVNDPKQNALSMLKESIAEEKYELKGIKPFQYRYGRITGDRTNSLSVLEMMADEAWTLGSKAWEEVNSFDANEVEQNHTHERKPESCPSWVSMSGEELASHNGLMFLPCGLSASSSITIIGTPEYAHQEFVPQLVNILNGIVMVSQFMVELQGLNVVGEEDPPKILHFNPRLKGDWSHLPVIEHNTCYRMQWGTAHRCDGLLHKNDEDMLVDGHRRCEKWMRSDIVDFKESKTASWFKRFIGRKKKPEITWPFPFVEGRLFVLTLRAGVDGYHISVGGRHVTSFPYRTGFTLQDATGLVIKGDVDVHSVYATSLPTDHPSFSPQRALEMLPLWKAPPIPKTAIRLFVGVLSATNHFAERMAVRKTWAQHIAIRSSEVAVRFFVAMNPRMEVNSMLKKEAEYFGDIVILPYMDHYELLVLKTIGICEFGIRNVTASYIMKCDDDTFVRVNAVLKEIKGISSRKSIYMGNLNLLHRPLRSGKWAVTYEEWPEEVFPPYANGPGYIISMDIAKYIVSEHDNQRLRLFKMEDVSMGMWVEQFNSSTPVQYSHNFQFCQYGCMQNYYTAHYQSPRQMICLWEKLAKGRAQCCNFR